MVVLFLGGAVYLALHRRDGAPEGQPLPAGAEAAKPPRAQLLPPEEMAKVRRAAADPDPAVRWSAIELLSALKDPGAGEALERTIALEQDPAIRLKAVDLLGRTGGPGALPGLTRALKDTEKDVRLAALRAIGDAGEPAAASAVAEALKDPEPDVRAEALRALGRVQDRRRAEFQKLSKKLEDDQEAARRRKQITLPMKFDRPKEIKID